MKGRTIIVIAIVLYFVSVFGSFVQDDIDKIQLNPDMGKRISLLSVWVKPSNDSVGTNSDLYRPLTNFSYILNGFITGYDPWGFRLVNIAMYSSVCWLVFEVLRRFFLKGKNREKIAFWATILFMVLPIHTEAVNNIVGRSEIISLGLFLLSVKYFYEKKWNLVVFAVAGAIMAKETGVVGVGILILLSFVEKIKKREKIRIFSSLLLLSIGYLTLRYLVVGNVLRISNIPFGDNPIAGLDFTKRAMNAFPLIPFGIGKIIFPWHLSYDYSFNQIKVIPNWLDYRVLLGVSLLMLSIISMFTKLGKNKLWVIGQALFWGPIAIMGNFIFPIGAIFGERLWFWPSLGVVFMGIVLFKKYFSQRWLFTAVIVIVLIFGVRVEMRNFDWLSNERLFVHDVNYAKDSVKAQSNAAYAHILLNEPEKAKISLELAEKINPSFPYLKPLWEKYYLILENNTEVNND